MFNKFLNLFSSEKKHKETKSVLPMPDIPLTEGKNRPEWVSETEQKIRDLGTGATQLKKQGNWDKAIECLQKQKELMLLVNTEYTPQNYMRLPKFLQQAGRMSEAIAECEDVLSKVQSSYKAQIYDDIRLIYSREKKDKEAYYFARLSDAWQAVMYKARPRNALNNWESMDFWNEKIKSYFNKNPNNTIESNILALFQTHLTSLDACYTEFKHSYKEPSKEKYSYIKGPEKLLKRHEMDFEKSIHDYLMICGNDLVVTFGNSLKSELNIEL